MKRKILITMVAFTLMILCNLIFSNQSAKAYYAYDSNNIQWYFDISNGEAKNVRLYSGSYDDTITIPDTITYYGVSYPVTSIGPTSSTSYGLFVNSSASSNRSNVKKVIIPSTVKSIGYYTFAYMNSLESIELPDGLETLSAYAFMYCNNLNTVNFPSNLKTIGNYAFQSSGISGQITFPEGLQTIGTYAFTGTRISGNLTIPDSVTSIGADAFENCSKLNGVLTTGTGLKDINGYVFRGTKFSRVNLGEVRSLGYRSFEGYTDLWIDNLEENVTLNSSGVSGDKKYPHIHYRNDTHNLEIIALPGIKLINQTTGEELTSGDYPCESTFEYKLQVEDGYNYSNLSIIVVDDNDNTHYKSFAGNTENVYNFESLIRDRKIYVQNLSVDADFALRMFVTEVNRNLVSRTRIPTFKMEDGEFKYLHTKSPVSVKTGDLVTFKVRVYNESSTAGDPGKIAIHIPDGLEFAKDNRTNVNAGWVYENGVAVTSKLQGSNIAGNVGNGVAKFKDVEIALKVTAEKGENVDTFRTVFAEIYQNAGDADSTSGNMNVPDATNYRTDELFETENTSFVRCGEDDEDFDTIYLRGKIKVDYNIVINKIDGDTKELLQGAKFNLTDKDGNIISTVESDQDGIVDFGGLSTYGSGTDIYYIQEIQTPLGYYLTDNKKIRVKVEKTILNEDNGLYSLKVTCDTLNYTIDTTRYDFTPIYTPEQFRKIGSGELVEIDGVKYQYNVDTNYKIMNDIDFSAEGVDPTWTPIDHEMKCIIDGNGYKIKGLRITSSSINSASEIGIFSVFSGVIENLELEDMIISFSKFVDEPENISGKTGVGAFAGVMREGYIINCKTSGLIATGADNVGGFIGHTLENGIVRIDGCTNNIEIHGNYSYNPNSWSATGNDNIGGIVGCCLGSISVNNSINNAQITNGRYNTGGLVGYVKPSEYQDISINTAYDEDNKILNLLVENITTEADYTVHLQDIDIDTEEALLGGVYTVYDGGKNILDGMENMELDEIMKKIVERQLRAVGLDTYYIIEEQPVKGYEPINGIVKLDVERYWDDEGKAYKFRISASIISDIKYEIAEPNLRTERPLFDRGDIFTDVKIEKANMNSEKAEFIDCTNNGEIVGCYMNGAGMVGTSHGYTYIEKCKNAGHINLTGYGKVGGMIAELYAFKEDCVIKDCENTGNMEAGKQGSTSPIGGMAGNVVADITVTNCKNSAQIVGIGEGGAAGILGDARGIINITSCENTGHIIAITGNSSANSYSVDSIAAGILAKNTTQFSGTWVQTSNRNDNIVRIADCTNTGDIDSSNHTGGMIAYTDALYVGITDCEVKNCNIHDTGAGDKGGMVGYLQVPNVEISNCSMDNVNLTRTSTLTNNTYGCSGSMVGNWCSYGWMGCQLNSLVISNCSATDSVIHTYGQNVGGMLGIEISYSKKGTSVFTDCYVSDCTIINDRAVSTYGGSGGIFGNSYGAADIIIKNCVVENSSVTSRVGDLNGYGGDIDAGGIFGMGQDIKSMTVTDCDVIDSTVTNISKRYKSGNSYSGDGCAAAGGIVAEVGTSIEFCDIENCNVINTDVSTNAGTVGGIIGHSGVYGNYSDTENFTSRIINCTYKGGTIQNTAYSTSASIAAGIVGYCTSRQYAENCLVENAKINNLMENREAGTNTAGILGMCQSNSRFVNCDVKDTDLYCTGAYGSKSNYGDSGLANITGIVGHSGGIIECTDCDVDNSTFVGPIAGNVAGLTGSDCSYTTIIDNCSVTNCTMENGTDAYDRGACCTVAGFSGYAGQIQARNSRVENVTLKTKGSCTGGILAVATSTTGEQVFDNLVVSGLTIIDAGHNVHVDWNGSSNFYARSIGGLAGYAAGNSKVSNIEINDVNITAQASNIGGAFGCLYSSDKFQDVNISELTINNDPLGIVGNCNSVGGVIGDSLYATGVTFKDITVSDSTLKTKCNNTAGFAGTILSNSTLDNVKIDNVKIESTNEYSSPSGEVGGLIGVSSADITIKNSEVKNSSVKQSVPEGSSFFKYAGGLIGFAYNTVVNNTNVINTPVINEAVAHTGGFIGMIYRYEDSINDVKVECTLDVNDSSYINGEITSKGYAGGIVGMANETTLDNVAVNKATITSTSSNGIAGGFVGMIPNSERTLTVTDSSVTNGTSITGKTHLGGILGVGKIAANNNTISNLTVTLSDTNPGAIIGGLVGISQYGSSIDGVTANNITMNPNSCHTGGLAGVMNGNISNVTMDTVNVEMEDGFGEVGGVAAIVNNGTLNNITVNNATIKARSTGASNGEAGAVAGVVCGGLVNNATVTNSTISSNKEAGGIAGVIGGNLVNSTVDNVTVTVSNVGVDPEYGTFYGGDCGGAVGACAGTIENVTVTNSTITSSEKLAGGIVGAGSTASSVLKDLVVDSNTVTYGADEMTDGTYIGAPNLTVTFSDPNLGGNMIMEEIPEEVIEANENTNSIEEEKENKDSKETILENKEVQSEEDKDKASDKQETVEEVSEDKDIVSDEKTAENENKEEIVVDEDNKEDTLDTEDKIISADDSKQAEETTNIEAGDKPEKEDEEVVENEESKEEIEASNDEVNAAEVEEEFSEEA